MYTLKACGRVVHNTIAWSSKKQLIVTLSTAETEFVAAAMCVCQVVWVKRIFKELSSDDVGCVQVMCDNSSTLTLSKNSVLHGKHIDVRYHFLRNLTREGEIKLCYCTSEDQVADLMTKPLKLEAFLKLRSLMGVRPIGG